MQSKIAHTSAHSFQFKQLVCIIGLSYSTLLFQSLKRVVFIYPSIYYHHSHSRDSEFQILFSLIWVPFVAREVTRTYPNRKQEKRSLQTWTQQCAMVIPSKLHLLIELRPQKTLQRTQPSQRPVEGDHSKKA